MKNENDLKVGDIVTRDENTYIIEAFSFLGPIRFARCQNVKTGSVSLIDVRKLSKNKALSIMLYNKGDS